MALNVNYRGVAKGGIGGFLAGAALTLLAQAAGVATVAPGVPVATFVALFTFLGAVYEGLGEEK